MPTTLSQRVKAASHERLAANTQEWLELLESDKVKVLQAKVQALRQQVGTILAATGTSLTTNGDGQPSIQAAYQVKVPLSILVAHDLDWDVPGASGTDVFDRFKKKKTPNCRGRILIPTTPITNDHPVDEFSVGIHTNNKLLDGGTREHIFAVSHDELFDQKVPSLKTVEESGLAIVALTAAAKYAKTWDVAVATATAG